MRITNLMIQMNMTSGMQGRLAALAKASTQASTGVRVSTMSDDPVAASQIMRLNSQVADIDQYRKNGTYATTRLSTEDAAITSLRDLLSKAKQLAMTTTASDPNDPNRQAALQQAQDLKNQIVSLGNTQVGDQYIFAGDNSTVAPFQPDGTYVGYLNQQTVEINSGVSLAVNHPGQPLFTDAVYAVNTLIAQLASGTPAQISATGTSIDSATQGALGIQADTGARMQDIQTAGTQLATQSSALLDRRDSLQNVDQATAIVELQAQQTALQQAYDVVGRVMQTNLLDYLK